MTVSEEESQQKAIAEHVKRELTENVFPDDTTFAETFFGLLENHVRHTQRVRIEAQQAQAAQADLEEKAHAAQAQAAADQAALREKSQAHAALQKQLQSPFMVRAELATSTSVDMNTDHQGSATDIGEVPRHFGAVPAQLDFTTTGGAAQAHPERNRVYDPRPRVAISESILLQILQSLQLTQERLAESQYQHQQAQAQATET